MNHYDIILHHYIVDYYMILQILTFTNNVSEQVIPITILQDDIPETDELFLVQLNSLTGGAILGDFNTSMCYF